MMVLWFEPPTDVHVKRFQGPGNPREDLSAWMDKWYDHTTKEWVHLFFHALAPIPVAWYLDAELRQCTRQWATLRDEFLGTFGLTGGLEVLEGALQALETMVLSESSPNIVRGGPTWKAQIQDNVEPHKATIKYCNVDPRKVSIVGAGEERTVAGPPIQEVSSTKPLKPRSAHTEVPPKQVTSENF